MRSRAEGHSASASSAHPASMAGRLPPSQPGRCPPNQPPKIPSAMELEVDTLNPTERALSLVSRAMAGASDTAYRENATPLKHASASSGTRLETNTRITEIAPTDANDTNNILPNPQRRARAAAGKMAATIPAVDALFTCPTKSSRKPKSSRYRGSLER